MRNLIRYIALVAALLATAPAQAEIYHWIDDQGVPHYSNQKPPATDKTLSTQEEIPYDSEADHQRREAEAAAWKEELERDSREEQARLKLEAERLATQRQQRASQAPGTIIQNNVYKGNGGSVYYPSYCRDGLPPPCRPILTPHEKRQLYHRRYYQSSPYFRGHLYYGNTLNYRPARPGAGIPPTGGYPPAGRPPVIRPPVVRPPGARPPVVHPPIIGRPRPAPYR